MDEYDLTLTDGRTLHVYDREPAGTDTLMTVYWHGGTPNLGLPPEPMFALSDELGIRWLGHDRPGYGGSTSQPGRTIASVAADTVTVADALEVAAFHVAGQSGGAPHALACADLLPTRVLSAVAIAGPAPFGTPDFDPYAGMIDPGALKAAAKGRKARAAYEKRAATAEPKDPFTPGDHAALEGEWSWFMETVPLAMASGPDPAIDDDVASAGDWGFMPGTITRPVRIIHGADDLMVPVSHAHVLAGLIGTAELEVVDGAGHISVLSRLPRVLQQLAS